jgi:hypothetical protein
MIRRVGFALLLFAFVGSSPADASLRWADCESAGGRENYKSACDGNSGKETLVVSTSGSEPETSGLVQIEIGLRIESPSTSVPDWWQVGSFASCRQGALSVSLDFDYPPFEDGICANPWLGLSPTAQVYGIGGGDQRWLTLAIVITLPVGETVSFKAGESYVAQLVIMNQRTVDAGACSGCRDGVCITTEFMEGLREDGSAVRLDYNSAVTWQGAGLFTELGCAEYRGAKAALNPFRGLMR